MRVATLPTFVVVFLSVACSGTDSQLRARAALEMKCPEDQLKISTPDPRVPLRPEGTKAVEGCGQRAIYEHRGDQWVRTAEPSAADQTSASPDAVTVNSATQAASAPR